MYTCNSGYALIGQQTRECNVSGQWTNDAPSCTRKLLANVLM